MADLDMSQHGFQRAVLSAPTASGEVSTLNIVILTVSILSILGAGWIILSFCVSDQTLPLEYGQMN